MNNYRVEIVANQSVEDDITELLEEEIPELEYTVDKKKASAIKTIIAKIRERFPKEGISFFCVEEAEL